MLESANVLCDCWRMEMDAFGFEHTYRALPEQFYARREPTAVDGPRLFALNKELATRLRLPLPTLVAHGAQIFSGNQLPPDAQPIAPATPRMKPIGTKGWTLFITRKALQKKPTTRCAGVLGLLEYSIAAFTR